MIQSIFEDKDRIYKIVHDIDLEDVEIIIPDGCTLDFQGGSINNGTVRLNGTDIKGVNKLEDCGTAEFIGTFREGLMLYIDNKPCYYNGSEWVELISKADNFTITATAEHSSRAGVTASLVDGEFKFEFELPRGEKGEDGKDGKNGARGPRGEVGPQGATGPLGIPGVDIEMRYMIGNEDGPSTAWSNSLASMREPTGWTKTVPEPTSTYLYVWFIQSRIVHKDNDDTTGSLENGTWDGPHRLSGLNGLNGDVDGKKGQIIYPAGVYSTSVSYTTDDVKAPYVFDPSDNNFYVLNAVMTWKGSEQNNLTPAQSWAQSGNNYWVQFEDFEAMYTRVGIIANGLIGSAVFNGDYMFSQQGINSSGEYSDNYELFNGNDPMATTNTFRPNICMNFKTGETWLNAGDFHVHDSGNTEFKGNIVFDGSSVLKMYNNSNVETVWISGNDSTAGSIWLLDNTGKKNIITNDTIWLNNTAQNNSVELDSSNGFIKVLNTANNDYIRIDADLTTIQRNGDLNYGYTGTINGAKFVNGICVGVA